MDWLFGRAAVGLGRAGPAGVAHAHEQHVSVDEVLAASPQITISNGLITARIAPRLLSWHSLRPGGRRHQAHFQFRPEVPVQAYVHNAAKLRVSES